MKEAPALRPVELLRILWRSLFIQATWNYERMQSLGYCFALIPFVQKLFDAAECKRFLRRNLEFFNTHPYMVGFLLGATMNLEYTARRENLRFDEINRLRKRLSESSAGIGDQLFWRYLKPVSAIVGVLLCFHSPVWGLVAFLSLYNLPHFYVRVVGLQEGIARGVDVVQSLTLQRFRQVFGVLKRGAAFASGLLLVVAGSRFGPRLGEETLAFSVALLVTVLLLRRNVAVPAILLLLVAALLTSGLVLALEQ